MEDDIDNVYRIYDKLSSSKNISECSEDFVQALEGSKGSVKARKLTCQIIGKYFHHFEDLQEQAINTLIDLCEDTDSSVRKSAVIAMPVLCKNTKKHTSKIADILAQLFQVEEQDSMTFVRNSLLQVFNLDPVTTCEAVFSHIKTITDNVAREKCITTLITFLSKHIDKSNTKLEDLLVNECKIILKNASSQEFITLMSYLKTTKLAKSFTGQQELLNLIAIQAELDRDFDPLEEGSNNVDRIITCFDFALLFVSAKVESTKFVVYLCDQVLPHFDLFSQYEKGEFKQLQILRQLAQLSTYCGKLDNPSLYVVQIFDKIKSHMPVPPEEIDMSKLPNLDFSSVECLLYAFHRLARQCPDFLTHDPGELKEFRARLLYFSRILQSCHKGLIKTMEENCVPHIHSQQAKVAPKLLSNVNSLVKDLFYTPPVYKCNITLSFLDEERRSVTVSPEIKTTNPVKRHVPITFDSNNSNSKQSRTNKSGENVRLYTPPGGKFSNTFQSQDRGRMNRGRGRGFRGRGMSRPWRN